MNKPKALPLSVLSDAALRCEAEKLREATKQIHESFREVIEEQRARLEFAGAVPIHIFSTQAVSLVEGLKTDPRPVVITVVRYDRSCILRLVDPNDLPEQSRPISCMGQYANRIIREVSDSGVRMGIRRGGGRNADTVAELCPPNQNSDDYLAALREIEALRSFPL